MLWSRTSPSRADGPLRGTGAGLLPEPLGELRLSDLGNRSVPREWTVYCRNHNYTGFQGDSKQNQVFSLPGKGAGRPGQCLPGRAQDADIAARSGLGPFTGNLIMGGP